MSAFFFIRAISLNFLQVEYIALGFGDIFLALGARKRQRCAVGCSGEVTAALIR